MAIIRGLILVPLPSSDASGAGDVLAARPARAAVAEIPVHAAAELLKQAPDPETPYFRVPKVIER